MREKLAGPIAKYLSAMGGLEHTALWYKNLQSGEVVEVNGEVVYPAASVIKLAIMVEAFRQAATGDLFFDSLYSVHESRVAGGSGILKELHAGIAVSLRDLVKMMIVLSDNTATNMVIDLVGMQAVNDTLARLGLKDTVLKRKLMGGPFYARPDYSLAIDNTLTARDIGRLLALLTAGQVVDPASDAGMLEFLLHQQVNDRLPLLLPAPAKVAHKTGEFQTTRHDAGVVYGPEGPLYVLVLLTRDLPTPAKATWRMAEFSREVWDAHQ